MGESVRAGSAHSSVALSLSMVALYIQEREVGYLFHPQPKGEPSAAVGGGEGFSLNVKREGRAGQ